MVGRQKTKSPITKSSFMSIRCEIDNLYWIFAFKSFMFLSLSPHHSLPPPGHISRSIGAGLLSYFKLRAFNGPQNFHRPCVAAFKPLCRSISETSSSGLSSALPGANLFLKHLDASMTQGRRKKGNPNRFFYRMGAFSHGPRVRDEGFDLLSIGSALLIPFVCNYAQD